MFANEKSLNRLEVSAMISTCGLLFIVAFTDLAHLSWAIPAMTLFAVAGVVLFYALVSKFDGDLERLRSA
jgi:O-antigen/teichoic acid export membrane protein